MMIFFYVVIFFLGASIVSFATVFASDFDTGSVFSHKRSTCDYCHAQIPFYYTIPVLGYLVTLGKCFKCHTLINSWYPLSELFGGTMLVGCALLNKNLFWTLPIFVSLAILSASDFQYGYIYSYYYIPLIIPALLNWQQLFLLDGLLIYFLLYVFHVVSNSLGLGDVEVMAILACLWGYEFTIYILFIACCFCIIINLFNKKRSFRFIPYLSMATGIIYLIFIK